MVRMRQIGLIAALVTFAVTSCAGNHSAEQQVYDAVHAVIPAAVNDGIKADADQYCIHIRAVAQKNIEEDSVAAQFTATTWFDNAANLHRYAVTVYLAVQRAHYCPKGADS